MPLPVAHALLGASIVAAVLPPRHVSGRSAAPLFAGALLANAADLDFLLVFALHSRAWHRGFTHSLVFALCLCLVFVLYFGKRRVREAVAYGMAYASHALLDCLTTKEGGGVELLWPFSKQRLALGWWGLSEVPSRLPPSDIVKALGYELALFVPLLLVVLLWKGNLKKRRSSDA